MRRRTAIRCCWWPCQRGQRDAVRQSELQFHARHCAGRRHHPGADVDGGAPVGSGQDGSGIHRLRQGQSRQGQYGSAGTGSAPHMAGELFNVMAGVSMIHVPYRGKGRRFRICSAARSRFCSPPRPERWITSGPGSCVGSPSPPRHRRRFLPELPPSGIPCPVTTRASGTASVPKIRPQTSSTGSTGKSMRRCRSRDENTVCRPRRRAARRPARGIRQVHRRGNREMGQGGQGCGPQGGGRSILRCFNDAMIPAKNQASALGAANVQAPSWRMIVTSHPQNTLAGQVALVTGGVRGSAVPSR